MVQLEQYEPTAVVSTEADPNVEVNQRPVFCNSLILILIL